mgnify:CR=1 FL=1
MFEKTERTAPRDNMNAKIHAAASLRQEIEAKYTNQLSGLKQLVHALRKKFTNQLALIAKDASRMHLQHSAEKSAIKEQVEFIYNKYKEKKEENKEVIKMLEKEKKHRENQRKIYEKLFKEGLNLEDVKKVMERYQQREIGPTAGAE